MFHYSLTAESIVLVLFRQQQNWGSAPLLPKEIQLSFGSVERLNKHFFVQCALSNVFRCIFRERNRKKQLIARFSFLHLLYNVHVYNKSFVTRSFANNARATAAVQYDIVDRRSLKIYVSDYVNVRSRLLKYK
jgi:hypothetical protein